MRVAAHLERSDPSNWTPTTKACVDGLVDAGVWPDDDQKWVWTSEPTFTQGGQVVITLTPIEESAA